MPLLNLLFALLALLTPTCHGDQVTNCKYEGNNTSMVSLQYPSGTMYFEVRNGILTDLETYPK